MFISNKNCSGIGECIKECPTDSIRFINGKAFSCITCGKCEEVCPNSAIFQNKYKGYVVDRSKCNGCGICEFNCPVNAIKIEEGIVKGICARCGICTDYCPDHARIDGFELVEENQLKYLKSLNLVIPSPKVFTAKEKDISRNCVSTNIEKCILCGRCDYYCPTSAIIVKNNQEGFCTSCRVCSDLCPADAIDEGVIDNSKCVLCLDCIKNCPNDAIAIKESNDFELEIKMLEESEIIDNQLNVNQNNIKSGEISAETGITGSIVSCLNCGLCVKNCESGALTQVNGKIRYSPNLCLDCDKENCISVCPVQTLRTDTKNEISNLKTNKSKSKSNNLIKGYCVSCGKCVKFCDRQEARNFKKVIWNGEVSKDCISCGICSELCPEDAITLKRGKIVVDHDKCILCETCSIHCPKYAIPTSTMAKKEISDGFNIINNDLCMKCELCYKICPEDAIINNLDKSNKKGNLSVDDTKCIYCGACYNACPARAFIFEREFENLI